MAATLEDWMKSGAYLPAAFRDFHDQKDVFKAIHETINVEKHEYAKDVSWVAGQCYVIDIFLWYMARRGYTLQRSRQRLPFRDLHEDVTAARQKRDSKYNSLLRASLSQEPQP